MENSEKSIIFSGEKRFLVMARVGDSSLHKQWIEPNEFKNFDLFLEYFGDGSNDYRNDCDFYTVAQETKWPRLYNVIEKWGEEIFKYDAIWIPDDDISTNCKLINELFELFMDYRLDLAQPALTRDSYYSHKITLENKNYLLRYTNFIEVMVPIFSTQSLQKLWKTFRKSKSGWGLDFVWPKLLSSSNNKIAMIDKLSVKHVRPVRSGKLYQDINMSPFDELHQVCEEYGVSTDFDFKVYGGIPKDTGRGVYQQSIVFSNSYKMK